MSEIQETFLGRIYKIVNSDTDDIYIGSTKMTLKKRFEKHLGALSNSKKSNFKIYKLMKELGSNKFKIVLLEDVMVKTKEELLDKENYFIKTLNPSLNMRSSFGRDKIKRQISNKNHYQKNKEIIIAKVKKYNAENKERIKEISKKYREVNKEKIKAKKKQKYICECGSDYTICHKLRHLKTKKHQEFIKQKEENKQ
jgi:hypothetical protein